MRSHRGGDRQRNSDPQTVTSIDSRRPASRNVLRPGVQKCIAESSPPTLNVTENARVYKPRMAAKVQGRRAVRHLRRREGRSFRDPGMKRPAVRSADRPAGKKAEELATFRARFDDLSPRGWTPSSGCSIQDRDGVGGEILYPTVAWLLCNHPDVDYKRPASTDTYLVDRRISAAHPRSPCRHGSDRQNAHAERRPSRT